MFRLAHLAGLPALRPAPVRGAAAGGRRRLLQTAALVALGTAGLATWQRAAAAPGPGQPLVLGVLPNIGAAQLLGQYELLRQYLERVNPGLPLRVVVPSSFKAFFDAMVRGDFDLAVSAPHLARLAQIDHGLQPLVAYEPRIEALLVTSSEGPGAALRDAAGLRGQVVAFSNPQSLVALYALQWLRGQGLEPGRDFDSKGARSDMGVGRMVLLGEAAAAVMSQGELRALPAEERARLRTLAVMARIPNFIVLAHPRLDRDWQLRLRQQLKAAPADADAGAAFAKALGLVAIGDAEEPLLRELDPHLPATRRAMGL